MASRSSSRASSQGFLTWSYNFEALVGDSEGYDVFERYLRDEGLDHVLVFR
jgi:hypothetical protein